MIELQPEMGIQAGGSTAGGGAAAGAFRYEMKAQGAVKYAPQRADPARGFGPHEVHPQMVQVVRDNCARLEHNGDWLVLMPPGSETTSFAITRAGGGRMTAEKLAVLRNDGMPTRVVELDGSEGLSTYTAEAVRDSLEASGHGDV